jgi:NCS2 family nucleobase:cation symporter-2
MMGIRAGLGLDPETLRSTASRLELVVSAGTLAVMIGLNLWGRGPLRMLCAITGVTCGYVAAVMLGATDPDSMRRLADASYFALPAWSPSLPRVAPDLVVPFLAAALTCALRAMGDVSVAQKINDRDWLRPDMASIRKGITSNGLSTLFAGLAGVIGGNTQSSGIGMSNATGVTSRWVAYWLGGMLIVLSMVPVVSAVLVAMPRCVIAAMLLFASSFIVISGLQVITSRLLDARRTFTVGLALTLSLSREMFPLAYESAPFVIQPLLNSGLVLGLLTALGLNALFRFGVRTRAAVTIEPSADAHETVRGFLEQQGAKWGARRDVIERAVFGTEQSLESIFAHCSVQGPVALEAAFDEFNLDIRISYQGEDFVLSERRPSEEQIVGSDDGLRLLAGYLIQRNADRVRASRKRERAVLEFHFQH